MLGPGGCGARQTEEDGTAELPSAYATGRRKQILLCAQHLIGTCANRVTWHASISVLLLAPGVHKEFVYLSLWCVCGGPRPRAGASGVRVLWVGLGWGDFVIMSVDTEECEPTQNPRGENARHTGG